MARKNLIIYFALIFILLSLFNIAFPNQGDDYPQCLNASNPDYNFFTSYYEWNGRFGELIWSGYFAKFIGSFWFDVSNAFVGSIFIFAFFYLIFASLPKNKLDYLSIAVICCLLLNDDFINIFAWGAGASNYLWGIGLILLFLIPYRLTWNKVYLNTQTYFWKLNLKEILYALFFIFLAVPAGCSSEHIGAFITFILFISVIYAWHKKVKLPLWYIIGAISFFVGWLILFNSPGSEKRALKMAYQQDGFLTINMVFKMPLVDKIKLLNITLNNYYSTIAKFFILTFLAFYIYKIKNVFNNYKYNVFAYLACLLLSTYISATFIYVMAIVLMGHLIAKLGREYLIYLFLFLGWILIGCLLIQLKADVEQRARFGDSLLLISMIVLMFRDVYLNSNNKNKIEKIILSLLILFTSFYLTYWGYYGYNWHKFEQIIKNSKNNQIYEITIPKEQWDNKIHLIDPRMCDENCAKYYGIKSITVK